MILPLLLWCVLLSVDADPSVLELSPLLGSQGLPRTQISELHDAHFVLLHEPGLEVELASLHPAGALFETHGGPRLSQAVAAHRAFRGTLEAMGVRTATIREVLRRAPRKALVELAAGSSRRVPL